MPLKLPLFLFSVSKRAKNMKKEKKIQNESAPVESFPLETDQSILDQISKRNDENQALKKLLDNLNSSFSNKESKATKS